MPTTVPNKPKRGLIVAIVPNMVRLRSRLNLTSELVSFNFDSNPSLFRSLYLYAVISNNPSEDISEIFFLCLKSSLDLLSKFIT